jgi:hypothetical protein
MRIFLLILFIGLGTTGYPQNGEELDKRNGFKDIKLLSDVNAYTGLEFSKSIKHKPEHSIYRPKKGSYEMIGEVEIKKLTVYTYRNLIYQIEVTTNKNEKLYRSYEKAFGKINSSIASKNSYWEGKKVRLNYEVEGAKKVKLTYLSKEINRIIALDKKKAVDSLSTEF